MERELRITALRPHREKGPHGGMFRPAGFKIDLKTETATQPRCLKAIPCSGRTVESKNLFQKTEHKSCCKHDTFGRGIFVRVSPVAFFGTAGRLGFLTLIAV
jgi:hypothetical protein